MTETIVGWMLLGVGVYLSVGLPVAIIIVTMRVQEIDPQAVGGSWGFRLAILPGAWALWPFLLRRVSRGTPPPEERNPHRDAARGQARSGGGP